jgi:hypothetical protein
MLIAPRGCRPVLIGSCVDEHARSRYPRSAGRQKSFLARNRELGSGPHRRKTPPAGGSTTPQLAPVAQLDRALPSGGRGHRFESCRARHLPGRRPRPTRRGLSPQPPAFGGAVSRLKAAPNPPSSAGFFLGYLSFSWPPGDLSGAPNAYPSTGPETRAGPHGPGGRSGMADRRTKSGFAGPYRRGP